jgi:hypothetical protein
MESLEGCMRALNMDAGGLISVISLVSERKFLFGENIQNIEYILFLQNMQIKAIYHHIGVTTITKQENFDIVFLPGNMFCPIK